MAGTVLAVGVVVGAAVLAVGYGAVGAAAVASQRIASAADSAALAAADTVLGAASGEPCERAAELAALASTTLAACEFGDDAVVVVVLGRIGAITVEAAARAGPAPDGGMP